MPRAGEVERLPGFPLGKGPNAMSRIKPLRQSAAQQIPGQGQPAARRLEELDEEQQALPPGDEAAAAEAPAADVPAPTERGSEAAAPDDAADGTGSRRLVIGGVALGAIGLVGAASGGGGGKSGDWKPPIAEAPKPEIPQPQPEKPKPDEQQPQPEAPKPEVPQPQPEAPKPDEQHPQPETPKPEVPQPQPEAPKPDEQQPQPETPKPDVEPPTPEQPGKPETPETPVNPNPDKPEPGEPTKPTPQRPPAPTVALTVDSGFYADDRLTNKADLTVTGLLPGATWKYSIDGGNTWKDGGSTGTISGSEFVGDGQKSVSILQTDEYGSTSESNVFTFLLDTTPIPFENQTVFLYFEGYSSLQGARPLEVKGTTVRFPELFDWNAADIFVQWALGEGTWHDLSTETFDFYQDLSAEFDQTWLKFRVLDLAGNESVSYSKTLTGVGKFAPPPSPSLKLMSDTGPSNEDRVTNNGALQVTGLVKGMTWKYSLDNGVTWKTGGADHQIAASEFGGIPGLKNVQVVQVNASNKESAAAHFDFTLQLDDVLGAHGATNSDPTLFTGTSGMDKFKVNAADGKKLSIVGYDKDQGDVIDLSAVMTIPDGANLRDYIGGLNAGSPDSNCHFSINTTGDPSVDPKDVLRIDLGLYAAQPQVTILYDGGQTVI